MGPYFFLSFSQRKSLHVILGKWKKQGKSLELDWWSPLAGTYPVEHKFAWSWIRVLGLPLQFWTASAMKELGDECGGWIETEEETSLKNHLLWARLKVRGSFNNIPREVEVSDGDHIFSLPIWVEAPTRFRRTREVGLDNLKANLLYENGMLCFAEPQKVMETKHKLGLKRGEIHTGY